MPHVILPAEHTDADLILASQIADAVDSGELFVAWTPKAGPAIPEIEAELREPGRPVAGALARLTRGFAAIWRGLTGRPAAR
jgi:hypothetical protein